MSCNILGRLWWWCWRDQFRGYHCGSEGKYHIDEMHGYEEAGRMSATVARVQRPCGNLVSVARWAAIGLSRVWLFEGAWCSPVVQAERKNERTVTELGEKGARGERSASIVKLMYRVAEIRSEEDTSIKKPAEMTTGSLDKKRCWPLAAYGCEAAKGVSELQWKTAGRLLSKWLWGLN